MLIAKMNTITTTTSIGSKASKIKIILLIELIQRSKIKDLDQKSGV